MSTTGTRRASASPTSSTPSSVAPAFSAAVPGGVDHRPVGERVGVRDAELDEVGAVGGVGLADRQRRREVREAAHDVGHQRGAAAAQREGRGDAVLAGLRHGGHAVAGGLSVIGCSMAR